MAPPSRDPSRCSPFSFPAPSSVFNDLIIGCIPFLFFPLCSRAPNDRVILRPAKIFRFDSLSRFLFYSKSTHLRCVRHLQRTKIDDVLLSPEVTARVIRLSKYFMPINHSLESVRQLTAEQIDFREAKLFQKKKMKFKFKSTAILYNTKRRVGLVMYFLNRQN